ncbi:MAG: DNA-processing protein DprA, partial [Bdellovibrionota bacterium]
IAVLAHGLDRCYPRENEKLRDQIIEAGGLILSERLPGVSPTPKSFLFRNRLIAAWSQSTWMVEASYRSGALNTARWARDGERRCYAVPCYPGDLALAGNQKLLDEMEATPYWGPQSLGMTWPELAERTLGYRARQPQGWWDDDAMQIALAVQGLSISQGGVSIPSLLEWAITQGWLPQRFYTALQAAFRRNALVDRQGMVVSSRIFSE